MPVEFPPLICVIIWKCFSFSVPFCLANIWKIWFKNFFSHFFFITSHQLSRESSFLCLSFGNFRACEREKKYWENWNVFHSMEVESYPSWKSFNSFAFHTLETLECAAAENWLFCAEMEFHETFVIFYKEPLESVY